MTKKYRYHAPKNIGIIDAQWKFLKLIDGKIVKVVSFYDGYAIISQWNYAYPEFKVFAEDLEEIEDGPVSAGQVIRDTLNIGKGSCGKAMNYSLPWHNLISLVKKGEQNDRKRTQPLIDAYENILRLIRQGREGHAGFSGSVYCDIRFGVKGIDKQYQALQEFKEQHKLN